MTIAIKFQNIVTEIGPGDILHAFCSTISSNLEPNGWGSKYPKLLNIFYQGNLPSKEAEAALIEIREIIQALKLLPADKFVWDIENADAVPPPEYDETCDKSSLYTYFQTINGLNLAWVIEDIFDGQVEYSCDSSIISYSNIRETVAP